MFTDNFERLAEANTNFRQVLYTSPRMQLVAMSIPRGEDIGLEVHSGTEQFFMIARGSGEAVVGDETCSIDEGDLILVPAGTQHNVTNTGSRDLKLLTIYTSPQHADGAVQITKHEAETIPRS